MSRTLRRLVTREKCCNGNRESLRLALSRESIIWWALRTYHRRRAEYPARLAIMEQRGAQIIKLHSPKEADRWLALLASVGDGGLDYENNRFEGAADDYARRAAGR